MHGQQHKSYACLPGICYHQFQVGVFAHKDIASFLGWCSYERYVVPQDQVHAVRGCCTIPLEKSCTATSVAWNQPGNSQQSGFGRWE